MQMEWPPHRVLVVEDDPIIRDLNTRILTDAGYNVDTAEDGVDAWDALKLKRFDLLITDNFMPVVTGLELIEKVRAAGMTLPVIMATGTCPMADFTRSPWLKPTATLIKPYTQEEFLGAVKNVLGRTLSIVACHASENEISIVLAKRHLSGSDDEMPPIPNTPRVEGCFEPGKLEAIMGAMAPELPSKNK